MLLALGQTGGARGWGGLRARAGAAACAGGLAAEQARRRAQHGPPPGSAAEELRRLVDTVADKLAGLQSPLL
ncbi:DUF5304 family protein, partial [Streptomyces galbus]|uniref:DUF5304 family protein n=1 Tax=Streptomyces galbus TaxID=33898 RepID=UPI0035E3E484